MTKPIIQLKVGFFPPSTNVYYRRAGLHTHISTEARLWKQELAGVCLAEGYTTPFLGNVRLTIGVYRKQRDLDNYLKGIQDALQGFAYEDDKQIADLRIYRGTLAKKEAPYLLITVEEI